MPESEQPEAPQSPESSGGDVSADDLDGHPVQFPQLEQGDLEEVKRNVDRFDDVDVHVSIELGRVALPIREILGWREGNVVETEKLSGQPMEIMVNGRLFGKGEVVVVGDNIAIRITDLLKPELE